MANNMVICTRLGRFAIACMLLATSGAGWAAVGNVQFVLGNVRIRTSEGAERPAQKGDPVNVGDRLITGNPGTAQLRMIDDAFIAVRPDTEMEIKVYQFLGKADNTENAVLSLVRGTMRAFTGAISQVRKDRFSMVTPTATIGVRGSGNVAHYSPALGTINHTIQGAHGVQSINPQGQPIGPVFVTRPGVTVQVLPGQVPVRIPTPPIIREAVQQPRQQAQQGQGQQGQGGQQQRQGQGQQASSGGGTGQSGGDSGSTQAGGGSSSGGGSSDSSGGGTTSAGTSGTGDAPRVSSTTDSGLTTVASLGTVPLSTSTTTLTSTPTTVTGSTTSGGSVNLSTQTQTTSTGLIAAITTAAPFVFGPHALVSYGFSNAGSVISSQRRADPIGNNVAFGGKSGNLSSISRSIFNSNPGSSDETLSVDNAANLTFAATPTTLANGISFGGYLGNNFYGVGPAGQALTVSGSDTFGIFTNRLVQGGLNWISGPALLPIFISNVLTGSVFYTASTPSQPGDLSGTQYAASTVGSSMFVNLANQSVNVSVNVNLPALASTGSGARNWLASAANLAMDDGGGFFACAGCNTGPLARRSLFVSLNGQPAFGNINGQLTGSSMTGAILSYGFSGLDIGNASKVEGVAGVIGFSNPSFNISQAPGSAVASNAVDPQGPYQILLRARGTINGFDANSVAPNVSNSSVPASGLDDQSLTRTLISAVNPSRTQFNAQGQLVQFDTTAVVVTANTCGTGGICNPRSDEIPVTASIIPTASGGPATGGSVATVLDSGIDATTGIRWGRYNTNVGTVAVIDRVTGAVLNPAATVGAINAYLIGPTQNGPMSLPLSGVANYTLVGNTNPVDNLGNVGTLGSATFSADFSAQKVSASVAATVNGITWNASTQTGGVPIIANAGFEAVKPLNGTGTLNVSCSGGSCVNTSSANLAGRISGAFFGSTGQGAGIAYSLFNGVVTKAVPPTPPANIVNVFVSGTSVGGVAAFKR